MGNSQSASTFVYSKLMCWVALDRGFASLTSDSFQRRVHAGSQRETRFTDDHGSRLQRRAGRFHPRCWMARPSPRRT